MTSLIRQHLRGGRRADAIAKLTTTAALTLCLMMGVAACSSAGDSGADDASSSPAAGLTESEAAPSDGDREFSAQSRDASEPGEAADSSGPTSSAPRAPAIARHVISNGTVSLVSDEVATARREVQRIVDAQGGTITEENTETDDEGTATYARLVIRVPARSFSATMMALEKAAELRQSQRSSEDVTTDVIDTDVRVRAQEGSLQRVEQLLARADSLKEIIWIESQLTNRQAELDSLKSQQAWLSDQTSESTITIDIERKAETKQEKKERDDAGFLAGLKGGMKALGGFAVAMATIVGALLPFAIVLVVFGVPAWLLVRRSARRRRTAGPTPAAEPTA